ncbi:hypothetical protein NVI2019_PEGOAJLN_01317 [Providencia alcalifaciens]|uniref:Contact-dependent inhibition of growth factor CdiA n=1 Tax=Providencia alcalifaciens TaxID=126385 RepID=UPI00044ECE65|nr:Contact-dependent inhibition of growth factor CdiA [Providencia alcalifaciens]EUD03759.1 hypothetical protein HMPREF1565_1214 [Providencia alcalifaciens RIMD 1656011]CAG9416141.1 hypothetical protein NVI2019_PEGOAJLN_01317 [Providencia alcalifaciens]
MDNRGDLEAYYHALIDESLFFEYGPEYDILEVDESIFANSKDSEEKRIRMQTKLKEHIEKQKLMLERLEDTEEWKFLEDPEKSPYTQYTSDRNGIEEKKYNTTEYKDYLISDKFDDSRDHKGDFFDTSARENLLQIQQAHSNLTHAIKVNENNLSRIEIAHSSVFSLPVRVAPVLPNGDNSDFESQNNSNLGQALENKFKATGDKLAETFECTFGFACASDLDKAAKNPNLGKDLSNSDKVELGGTSSGAPNGWGPQDEEKFRNNPEQTIFTEDYLISSANKPINNQGLSAAARAWEKHAGRPNGIFDPLAGNPTQKNAVAEQFIKSVLRDPQRVKNNLSGGAFEYRLPNGKGIRYNADGSFNTVLDPKVKK